MEIYFPPFEGAAKAGVMSMMCGNNLVNGKYVCENNFTGNTILREWGGFKGWMCSDYDGTRSTIDAANNGLDIAMPGPPSRPDYFGAPLLQSIKNGRVDETVITEKAVRIVYSLAVVGALDVNNTNHSDADVTSPAHYALARKLSAASATLLRNKGGVLPLSLSKLQKLKAGGVAVIGTAAKDGAIYGGGGSGAVTPKAPVSVYDALLAKLAIPTPAPPAATCSNLESNTDYFSGDGTDLYFIRSPCLCALQATYC
jgi:beta-glucosidase